MGRFKLELIYLYFPPSSHLIYACFCPVGVVITTKGLQDRNIHILEGTMVGNKGKLILIDKNYFKIQRIVLFIPRTRKNKFCVSRICPNSFQEKKKKNFGVDFAEVCNDSFTTYLRYKIYLKYPINVWLSTYNYAGYLQNSSNGS